MEPKLISREILLFTRTRFCSRPFNTRDAKDSGNYSPMEELERACWDGMLHDMLPKLVGDSFHGRNSYIWKTISGVNFLCINLGAYPLPIDKQASIDPYFFLQESDRLN